jgi:hypothetical protein
VIWICLTPSGIRSGPSLLGKMAMRKSPSPMANVRSPPQMEIVIWGFGACCNANADMPKPKRMTYRPSECAVDGWARIFAGPSFAIK